PRSRDRDPHAGVVRRHDLRPGRRRPGRRFGPRDRVPGVGQQGARGAARGRDGAHRGTDAAVNLLLIDNYDSFTWNLAQYFGELGVAVTVERNDAITVDAIAARAPDAIAISP